LFVFTFITSGKSLVNERSTGIMTRFLATPVRPLQIVGGCSLGFGALALVQSAVILWIAFNAFQVIQLMLIFVVPQILLSGLFDLSSSLGWLQFLSRCFPLTYGVDALRGIMLRGAELEAIGVDLLVIWGFIALFFVLAALGFRKKRAKQRNLES